MVSDGKPPTHRSVDAHRHHQFLQPEGQAAPATGEGNLRDPQRPAMAAFDARNIGDEEHTMPTQAKTLPNLPARVANRLIDDPALRTVETAAPSVAQVNADMRSRTLSSSTFAAFLGSGMTSRSLRAPAPILISLYLMTRLQNVTLRKPREGQATETGRHHASEDARGMRFIRRKHERAEAKPQAKSKDRIIPRFRAASRRNLTNDGLPRFTSKSRKSLQ